MILDNKLRPGEKIIQEKLAADLGISRTPLRSALQMLEGEQLVQSIPRRAVYVKTFSDQEIIDIYDCRIALECQAVEILTKRASADVFDKLRSHFILFQVDQESIDAGTYQKADSKFHDDIIEYSGNQFLSRLFRRGNLLVCINRIGLVRPPRETLPEHFDIIKAMERRDYLQASKLHRVHLTRSQDMIIDRMPNWHL